MTILVSIPSRGRPAECKAAVERFAKACEAPGLTHLSIVLDGDDPSLMRYAEEVLPFANALAPGVPVCYVTEKTSKVAAINAGAKAPIEWDVLVVASDDLWPQKGFDQAIRTDFANDIPDLDGMLWAPDQNIRVACHPCIGKTYYQRDGYVAHPAYRSVYCDDEWTMVAQRRGKLFRTTSFRWDHHHPNYRLRPSDSVDKANKEHMLSDYRLFCRRMSQGFPKVTV